MKVALVISVLLVIILLAMSAGCAPAGELAQPSSDTPSAQADATGAVVSHSKGQGGPYGNATNLPAEIAALYPEDGSQACLLPQVGVDLLLTDAMRKDGSFDPSAVKLTLDGSDVTSMAVVRQVMTYPASRVTMLLTPAKDLSAGNHLVGITYPSAAGPKTHQWNFTASNVPCP